MAGGSSHVRVDDGLSLVRIRHYIRAQRSEVSFPVQAGSLWGYVGVFFGEGCLVACTQHNCHPSVRDCQRSVLCSQNQSSSIFGGR